MKLVLVRHGESEWNKANLFTGWVDVDLSANGIEEAKTAGRRLRTAAIDFNMTYTSVLKRAIKTLHYILDEIDQLWVQEYKSWRLNERHYGALSGLNKEETAAQYGAEQVQLWRRSYDILPPLLTVEDKYHPINDPRYKLLDQHSLPAGENLKTTLERVIPFWQDHLVARLRNHENILIVAHGNSLRALIKHLEDISDEDIMALNIPTGIPIIYELNDNLSIVDKIMLTQDN